MIFAALPLAGAFVIDIEPHKDERGSFARTFCVRDFERAGLKADFVQNSLSHNARRGTLRGMHFQTPPHEETKIVRCTRGAAYDVILDLRPDSPTWRRWTAVEITEANHRMVYIPEGFAHGFKTLVDDTVIEYQISAFHSPGSAAGVRWNDPSFAIDWPATPELVISPRDAAYPLTDG